MRVLYFSQDYTTHDRRYLLSLVKAGHQVIFLRLEQGPVVYEPREPPSEVEVVSWAGGQSPVRLAAWPRLYFDFRRVLKRVRPHLIHAGPVQSCGFLSALAGIKPLVVMSWGSDVLVDADRNPAWRWITRFTLRRADVVIGDCQAVRDKVRQLAGLSDDRIVTYPWGINLDLFQPGRTSLDLRNRLGWGNARIFLSTRSWEPRYQVEVLVEAFNLIADRAPDARLVILGDGSMAPLIRKIVVEGGHQDRIHLAGQVAHDQLIDYYRLADVYISTAPSDGTSISLLEAMACGLPVIVADALGNREWVMPDRNGWLFPAGNPQALAAAMVEVLAPGVSLKDMRDTNLAMVRTRADWRRNVQLLLSAYARALKFGASPSTSSFH